MIRRLAGAATGRSGLSSARTTTTTRTPVEGCLLSLRRRRRQRRLIRTICTTTTTTLPTSTLPSLLLPPMHSRVLRRRIGTSQHNVQETEKMRVAIIGGSVSGLSTALFLAPLVHRGMIEGPIDIYEKQSTTPLREIGVGIWSTALEGLCGSPHPSHQRAYTHMIQKGTWINKVGYRTPQGSWLLQSELPLPFTNTTTNAATTTATTTTTMPSLLFLKEKDLLHSLQMAVAMEEQQGTIQIHTGNNDKNNTMVTGIYCSVDSTSEQQQQQPWSAPLILEQDSLFFPNNDKENENHTPKTISERDYHFIVGAGGTYSVLRKTYVGVSTKGRRKANTRTNTNNNNEEEEEAQTLPPSRLMGTSALSSSSSSSSSNTSWEQDKQQEITTIVDRNYSVFRGNSKFTTQQFMASRMGEDGTSNTPPPMSFQTWGEGKRMRFATVPMRDYDTEKKNNDEDRFVWFITIDDDTITQENDPKKRKEMLLSAFANWHEPICKIVQATEAEDILMDRAIAHKHVADPILRIHHPTTTTPTNHTTTTTTATTTTTSHPGSGPAIVFIGDAFMTVDPILAQGFSLGMEGAKCLSQTLENLLPPPQSSSSSSSFLYTFDPYELRKQLKHVHHEKQMGRLVCVLRATELVEALGQPNAANIFTRILHKYILRPVVQFIPNIIKQPIFHAVMKYSVGFPSKDKGGGLVPPSSSPSPSPSSSSSSPSSSSSSSSHAATTTSTK